MAGDAETGVAVIELVAELDAGPDPRLRAVPDRARRRRRRGAGRGRSSSACRCWRRRCAARRPARAAGRGRHVRRTRSSPRTGASTGAGPAARRSPTWCARSRPHIGARMRARRRARHGVAGAGRPPAAASRARSSAAALRIACGEGAVEVLELQPAGRRRMAVGRLPARAAARRRSGRRERARRRLRGRAADVRGGRLHRPRVSRRGRAGGARRPRPAARDAACVRNRAAGADARPCAARRSRRGRPTSSSRRCARRCASAPTSSSSRRASPPRAAVNETVELCKRVAGVHTAGLANAVLRRIAGAGEDWVAGAAVGAAALVPGLDRPRSGRRCSARPTPRR